MNDLCISVRGLRKSYQRGPERITPLDGLDLDVARGEVVALVGPSGSGKSTLLHCLAGIEPIDSGTAQVCGEALHSCDARGRDRFRARCVGLVFQAFHLIPSLDALHNVLLGLAGRKPTAADLERARALLARVDLADRTAHRPGQLSGGQQQRVAIARALMHRPPLILADEPTGNLDASGARAMTDLLIACARDEGATVVIVTHDERVSAACDRIKRLEQGKALAA